MHLVIVGWVKVESSWGTCWEVKKKEGGKWVDRIGRVYVHGVHEKRFNGEGVNKEVY